MSFSDVGLKNIRPSSGLFTPCLTNPVHPLTLTSFSIPDYTSRVVIISHFSSPLVSFSHARFLFLLIPDHPSLFTHLVTLSLPHSFCLVLPVAACHYSMTSYPNTTFQIPMRVYFPCVDPRRFRVFVVAPEGSRAIVGCVLDGGWAESYSGNWTW